MSEIKATTRTLVLPDEAATQAWAQALARAVCAAHQAQPDWSMHLNLSGPLGVGKTTLVRHLLRALGFGGRVKSPTYTVLEPYMLPVPEAVDLAVSHFDLYRFADPSEWDDAGFREVLASAGLKLVEWPDKATGHLPKPDVQIELSPGQGEARKLRWTALTDAGKQLGDPPGHELRARP